MSDGVPTLTSARASPPGKDLPRGTTLGRFVVQERLASGGMGVVYAADDFALHRKVAIKVLLSSGGDLALEERLLEEARTMARLQHPNVLAVYDVGTFDGRIFMAMELIEGCTLREWLEAEDRPWRRIVEVFLDAGLGLAAAHDAGVVHRDFKPENVLISRDGRVRVADFGLAQFQQTPKAGTVTPGPTVTVGTPGYMAPEQKAGSADAKSDQYSFFVALREAIRGVRAAPLSQGDVATVDDRPLARQRSAQRPVPHAQSSEGRPLPAALRGVLTRGLALEPAQRFDSMTVALEALRQAARPRARRWVLAAALSAVVVAVTIQVARPLPCSGFERQLVGVWDASTAQAVERAFTATQRPYARVTWKRCKHLFDEFAHTWVAHQEAACAAAGRNAPAYEVRARTQCLDSRLEEVRTLTGELSRADDSLLRVAVQAATSVTSLRECDRRFTPGTTPLPEDPALQARLYPLRRELARVKALEDSRQTRQALPLAQDLARASLDGGDLALRVDAFATLGELEVSAGDSKGGLATLEEADLDAERGGFDWLAATIALRIAHADYLASELAGGQRWLLRARARIDRVGGDEDLEASLLTNTGALASLEGKLDQAQMNMEQALAMLEKTRGVEHPATMSALHNVAIILEQRGRFDESLRVAQRAADLSERLFGNEHPIALGARMSVLRALAQRGDFDQVRAMAPPVLAAAEQEFGADHSELLEPHAVLGEALQQLGEWDEAERHFRRVLKIALSTSGPDSPPVALAKTYLAALLFDRGSYAESLSVAQEAADLLDRAPVDPAMRWEPLDVMARVRLATGHFDQALVLFQRGLASQQAVSPDDLLRLSFSQTGVGEAYVGLREYGLAVPVLESAVKAREGHRLAGREQSRAFFALAQALWESGGDRARAIALAQEARTDLEGSSPAAQSDKGRVERWLATHAVGPGRPSR